jgi:ribonuclease HI
MTPLIDTEFNYTLVAFFDGCCEPVNPGGYASYGAVILKDGKPIWQDSSYVGHGSKMSNNVAEYMGVISIMKELQNLKQPCLIQGDSKLVIEQLSGRWEARKGLYLPYYHIALALCESLGAMVRFEWVPREQNTFCDTLSKQVPKPLTIQPTDFPAI